MLTATTSSWRRDRRMVTRIETAHHFAPADLGSDLLISPRAPVSRVGPSAFSQLNAASPQDAQYLSRFVAREATLERFSATTAPKKTRLRQEELQPRPPSLPAFFQIA